MQARTGSPEGTRAQAALCAVRLRGHGTWPLGIDARAIAGEGAREASANAFELAAATRAGAASPLVAVSSKNIRRISAMAPARPPRYGSGMDLDLSAAILTGGKGRRMGGAAKGLLEVDGVRIVERQLAVLRLLVAEVFLVGGDPGPYAYLGLPVVPDAIAGKGAPGGVHAALAHAAKPWVFCLACDMPFPSPAAIGLIASRREGARAVAPLRGGFPEPLFALYSKRCLPDFERALREGDPSLAQLLRIAGARLVPEAELEAVDPRARSLWNLNTPEDLARASGR